MAGPTLELGVAAAGLGQIARMSQEVEQLIARLQALPAAAANLRSLQAQLDKIAAPRVSKVGATDLKTLAGEIKAGNQSIVTALAELAGNIDKGFSKVSSVTTSSGRRTKSVVAAERAALQEEFEKMLASGRLFTPQGLDLAKQMGVSLLPGQRVLLKDFTDMHAGILAEQKRFEREVTANEKRIRAEVEAAWATRGQVGTGVGPSRMVSAARMPQPPEQAAADPTAGIPANVVTAFEKWRTLANQRSGDAFGDDATRGQKAAQTRAYNSFVKQAEQIGLNPGVAAQRIEQKLSGFTGAIDLDRAATQLVQGTMSAAASKVFDEIERKTSMAKAQDEQKGFAAMSKRASDIRAQARVAEAAAEVKGIAAADKLIEAGEQASMAARVKNRAFLRDLVKKDQEFQKAVLQAQGGPPPTRDDAWAQVEAQRLKDLDRVKTETTAGFKELEARAAKARNEARMASAAAEAAAIKAADSVVMEAERRRTLRQQARMTDGGFLGMNPVQQLGRQVGARGALDAGADVEVVARKYGQMATTLAAAAPSLDTLKRAHQELRLETSRAARAKPLIVEEGTALQVKAQQAVASLKRMAGERAAAEAEASRVEQFAREKAVGNIMAMAAKERTARAKDDADRAATMQRAVDNILRLAHKKAAAEKEANRIEAEALMARNARFLAASPAARDRAVLGARAQLDSGMTPAAVRSNFGDAALQAAQATTLASAYSKVHAETAKVNGEVGRAPGRLSAMSKAMQDAHSAARGLASGFGAMWLTWGNLGPLLAGAAVAHSFVQSIKVGLQARQELQTIKVLSEESITAVAALERQMVQLAERGPFALGQVAEAMRILSLAGLSAAQTSAALGPALNLAVAGNVGIEKAAESLVAVGTAYGYQAEQFGLVSDAIAKAAAISMSSVEGMMESFRSSSVVAQAYGVELKDTATILAALANIGIRNSAAGTSLRQMYSELSGASRQTRAAMKQLGVEIVDTSTGKMRPMIDIVTQLNRAMKDYSGPGRIRAIQEISNERGAKSIVALLNAIEEKAKQTGSTAENELARIRLLIEESHGFTAIAASELAATPLNQMKSVASSFQAALFESFTAIEPTILVVSAKLRETFGGEAFRGAVTGLASTVANLTVSFVSNLDTVKLLAAGYLIYKGAAIGLQVSQTALNIAKAFSASMTKVETAATVENTAATLANAAAKGAATGTTGALTVATTGLAAAQRASGAAGAFMLAGLGPLGLVLGGLAAAWLLLKATSADAATTEREAAAVRAGAVVNSLDAEIERLEKVNEELGKGIGLREAEARAAVAAERTKRVTSFQAVVGPIEAALAAEKAKFAPDNPADRLQFGREMVQKGDRRGYELIDSSARLQNLQNEQMAAYKEFDAQENAIAARQQKVAQLSRNNEELSTRTNPALGTKPWEDANNIGAQIAARMAAKEETDMLSALKARYTKQEQTIKQYHDQQTKEIEAKNKYRLVSEAEYLNTVDRLTQSQYDADLANLKQYVDDSADEIARLRKLKETPAVIKAVADITGEKQQMEQRIVAMQRLQAIEKEGRVNKSDLKLTEDLSKLRQQLDLQEQQVNLDLRLQNMDPMIRSSLQARTEAESRYTEILRKKVEELRLVQERLDLQTLRPDQAGPVDDRAITVLNAEIARLTGERDRIRTEAEAAAQRASALVLRSAAGGFESQSEAAIRSWRNTLTVMREAYGGFMTNIHQAGQNWWGEFLKTGKLSSKGLVEVFTNTFAEITYKKIFAPYFENIGNSVFGMFEDMMGVPKALTNTTPEGRAQQALVQLAEAGFSAAQALSMVTGAMQARSYGTAGVTGPDGAFLGEEAQQVASLQAQGQGLVATKTGLQNVLEPVLGSIRIFGVRLSDVVGGLFRFDSTLTGTSQSVSGALMQILQSFGGGFSSLMRTLAVSVAGATGTSGGGLLSTIGSFVAGIFGGTGGTGGGTGLLSGLPGGMGPSTVGMSQAKGGVWSGGVAQFARGAAFTAAAAALPVHAFAAGDTFNSSSSPSVVHAFAKGGSFSSAVTNAPVHAFAAGNVFAPVHAFAAGNVFAPVHAFAAGNVFAPVHAFAKGGSFSSARNSSSSLVQAFATGSTFNSALSVSNSSASKFARGGHFTNSIVSSPTYFAFGKGGQSLGLMGEAGPEAIMPLARGAEGLGVRMFSQDGIKKILPVTRGADGTLGVRAPTAFAQGGTFSSYESGGTFSSYREGDTFESRQSFEKTMPVERGPGGRVQKQSAGTHGKIEVHVHNDGPPLQVKETKESEKEDGGMRLDVIVDTVEQRIAGRVRNAQGPMHSAMRDRFGLSTAKGSPLQRPV